MWNKIRNIFRKQEQVSLNTTPKMDTESGYTNNVHPPYDSVSITDETSTHEELYYSELTKFPLALAIFKLRMDCGEDFVRSQAVLNALGDYKAFEDCYPARAIVKVLYSEGIYSTFINLPNTTNWSNEIEKACNRISNQFGYKEELVRQVMANILLGFGKCTTSDIHSFINVNKTVVEPQILKKKDAITTQVSTKYKAPYASYRLPETSILIKRGISLPDYNSLNPTVKRLEWVLSGYGVDGKIINIIPGPRSSLYEIQVAPTKLAKLARNEKDIILAIGYRGCRIINPLRNKLAIGFEIPNPIEDDNIMPGDIFNSKEFNTSNHTLPVAIGIDSTSKVICEDLAELSNLLICGGLEQGKTTLVYQIVASLIFKVSPDNLKFIIVHSNQLELYELSHLPKDYFAHSNDVEGLITERPDLYQTFVCLTEEMEQRIKLLQLARVKSIDEYNNQYVNSTLNPADGHHYLPRLICIVDEIQPFFNGKEWDDTLSQMFEKTKGVGVHFIFTTRYTSAESLTPLIRSYLPNKICFRINLPNESRLAMGKIDATNLLDKGDVLVVKDNGVRRCQTSNFEPRHLEIIINEINQRNLTGSEYILPEKELYDTIAPTALSVFDKDPLFDEVARFVVTSYRASTSSIQRQYSIGYNRASLIMDQLETAGIVGPSNGGKPRVVLVNTITLESILNA
ncbi:MAG: hypothetical protein K2H86_05230 [Muribaculaceae bacterium]|nr:hypothetical protein [Muribaculaceae bacterium]